MLEQSRGKMEFLLQFWAKSQPTCSYKIVHAYLKFVIFWSTWLFNSTRQLDSEENVILLFLLNVKVA